MISLYDYAKSIYDSLKKNESGIPYEALQIISENDFDKMISNDALCLKLIQAVLEFRSKISSENRNRASHIFITWLLGIGLGKHFSIDEISGSFGSTFYYALWLQSAMLHDYGYLCEELSRKDLEIDDITSPYSLFDSEYHDDNLSCLNGMEDLDEFSSFFTYDFDEVKNYYRYSQYRHRNDERKAGAELNDHGIIGGCIAFNKYCEEIKKTKKIGPSPIITQIQKIACFITASHNIFKSDNEEDDEKYLEFGLSNILSTSPIRINNQNKLLLLLSLVDTIECTKRFSARENKKEYLAQKTTLKKVGINFETSIITLDFSELYDYVVLKRKSEAMKRKIESHTHAVAGIESWTCFNSWNPDSYNKNRICIQYVD